MPNGRQERRREPTGSGPRTRGRARLHRDGVRGGRADPWRGGVLHRDVGLPGDPHRSQLSPTDRAGHRAADRQHRVEPGGRRKPGRQDLGGRLRGARSVPAGLELAGHRHPRRRTPPAGDRRDRRCGHPRDRPAPALPGLDAGRGVLRRLTGGPGRVAGPGAQPAADAGRRPLRRGQHHRALHRGTARPATVHRCRARSGHQDQHPPQLRTAGHPHSRPAVDDDVRRDRRPQARRGVPVQRTRRSRHRRPGGGGDPGGARRRDPTVRHLFRQPDPRPGTRPVHLQDGVRSPRYQRPGDRPRHRQGGRHRAEPRLRVGRRSGGALRHRLRSRDHQPHLRQRRGRRGRETR